jgi:hypothetical protein
MPVISFLQEGFFNARGPGAWRRRSARDQVLHGNSVIEAAKSMPLAHQSANLSAAISSPAILTSADRSGFASSRHVEPRGGAAEMQFLRHRSSGAG